MRVRTWNARRLLSSLADTSPFCQFTRSAVRSAHFRLDTRQDLIMS
jgi:hypothetical protein